MSRQNQEFLIQLEALKLFFFFFLTTEITISWGVKNNGNIFLNHSHLKDFSLLKGLWREYHKLRGYKKSEMLNGNEYKMGD